MLKINYLTTYTTILKKEDSDYYFKVVCVAETSKANNGHHASYPSPASRAIVTGVKNAWQRLTKHFPLVTLQA